MNLSASNPDSTSADSVLVFFYLLIEAIYLTFKLIKRGNYIIVNRPAGSASSTKERNVISTFNGYSGFRVSR